MQPWICDRLRFIFTLTLSIACLFTSLCVNAEPIEAHPAIAISGRVEFTPDGHALLGYSGTRLRFTYTGGPVSIRLRSHSESNWVQSFINGERQEKLKVDTQWMTLTFPAPADASPLQVELVKATEGAEGLIEVAHIEAADTAELLPWTKPEIRRLEFIGDSITCGYGIEATDANASWHPSTQNFCDTYAWHTAHALGADYLVVARSGIGMVRNYDGPYEGSDAALPNLYARSFFTQPEALWDTSRFTPDVVCINLGTNDFSTSGVNGDRFEAAYQSFVEQLLMQYPESTRIVCLLGPMLNNPDVKETLMRVVNHCNRHLVSPRVFHFELSPQGELGYGADWHPSKAQALRNARELTAYLRGLMHW